MWCTTRLLRRPNAFRPAPRSFSTKLDPNALKQMNNQQIIGLLQQKKLNHYQLETSLGDFQRAVQIRREFIASEHPTNTVRSGLDTLPIDGFDYASIHNCCCENVVGFVSIPVGMVGPLRIDGDIYRVPLATTEGALVASTTRGCKALFLNDNNIDTVVLEDGMTRAPVVRFDSAKRAANLKQFLADEQNFAQIQTIFNSTSNYAKLKNIDCVVSGRNAYLRFNAATGDAMGMNMVSKAVDFTMHHIQQSFPDMEMLSVSGNMCTDKKSSAINWIKGRGKSVVAEARISKDVVKSVLKSSVQAIVDVNINKNYIGSALAGSIGGFNAHAANLISALFLATGQDIAQNVESSNCLTTLESINNGEELYMSVTMPSIEVGTVGGGTHLMAQSSCLDMLGVRGSDPSHPGKNAETLARVAAATVMAGELSLIAALAEGHLVNAHMTHNRKK